MSHQADTCLEAGAVQRCDRCGQFVDRLAPSGQCELCVEIDARADALVAEIALGVVETAVESALAYVHPQDVIDCVLRLVERGGRWEAARLEKVQRRALAYVDARKPRASDAALGRLLAQR